MIQYVYILLDDHHNQFTPIATYRYKISFSLMTYFKIHSPSSFQRCAAMLLTITAWQGQGVRTGLCPILSSLFPLGLSLLHLMCRQLLGFVQDNLFYMKL